MQRVLLARLTAIPVTPRGGSRSGGATSSGRNHSPIRAREAIIMRRDVQWARECRRVAPDQLPPRDAAVAAVLIEAVCYFRQMKSVSPRSRPYSTTSGPLAMISRMFAKPASRRRSRKSRP